MTAEQVDQVEQQVQFYKLRLYIWEAAARIDYLSLSEGGKPLSREEMDRFYPGWTTEMFAAVLEKMGG
jgi:hypothetical protein